MRSRVIEALRIVLSSASPREGPQRHLVTTRIATTILPDGARGQEPPPYSPRSGRRLVGRAASASDSSASGSVAPSLPCRCHAPKEAASRRCRMGHGIHATTTGPLGAGLPARGAEDDRLNRLVRACLPRLDRTLTAVPFGTILAA